MNSRKLILITLISAAIGLMTGITAKAATFNVAAGDVAGLIAAINSSNANGEADVINLAYGRYTVTSANNSQFGPNAFPAITSEILILAGRKTFRPSLTHGARLDFNNARTVSSAFGRSMYAFTEVGIPSKNVLTR